MDTEGREMLPIEIEGPLREVSRRMEEIARFCRENRLQFAGTASEFAHRPGFGNVTQFAVDFSCTCASQLMIDNIANALGKELDARRGTS